LQDGTLIAEDITLFNREVTPAQYRRVAATDPRLPKLPGRIGKPPVHNRALERHSYRVFVAWLLKKRSRVEARTWLAAVDKKKRTFGRFKRASTAVKFVEELYQTGAVQVIAPEIYHNKRGDQFADCLLAQSARVILKRVGGQFSQTKIGEKATFTS
jgi:hypothetical protein